MKIEEKLDYLMEQVKRFHDLSNAHEWIKLYYPWKCTCVKVDKVRKAKRDQVEECACPNVYNVECACGVILLSVERSVFNIAQENYSDVY